MKKLKYSTKKPKTKIGFLLCWIGFHNWKYHNYRTCRRCGRRQTLYQYWNGKFRWED